MANKNENKKYHYLYKTTNLINVKYYYGMHSTNNLDDDYLGSGSYLRNAIHKHGKENFKREILEYFDSREELVKAEVNLITDELIQDKLCMNLKLGGCGGLIDKEHHLLMIAGSIKWNKNKWLDLNFREKISNLSGKRLKLYHKQGKINYNTFEGKNHTDETKEKISISMTGKNTGQNNGSFGTCWITNNIENKKIKKEELQSWINKGWTKGREMRKCG